MVLAGILLVLSGSEVSAQSCSVVTTFAGTAGAVGSTDDIDALARFDLPQAVVVSSSLVAPRLYVADTVNQTLRKLTQQQTVNGPVEMVSTLAGTPGSSGNADGMGALARFSSPSGVAVDSSGTVYVADTVNNAIRVVTASGSVSTLVLQAGSAVLSAPHGLALDASGNLYVANTGSHTIVKVTGTSAVVFAGTAGLAGSADGTGTGASFNAPRGVAVASDGTIYVADTGNHTIRIISAGGIVNTLAGDAGIPGSSDSPPPCTTICTKALASDALFNSPADVAVNAGGVVFVADTGNSTIRQIATDGTVTTVAGQAGSIGGTDAIGTAARFNAPAGISIDVDGNAYIADTGNSTIRKMAACPQLINLNPISGPTGTTVTINGVNLDPNPANDTVKFNAIAAPATSATTTSVTATVPAMALTGSVTVIVQTSKGPVTASCLVVQPPLDTPAKSLSAAALVKQGCNFTVTPTVSGFNSPTTTVGATLQISGSGFSWPATVTFNGASVRPAAAAITATSITAVVPVGALTGSVTVSTTYGSSTSPGSITILPKITSLSTSAGAVGTQVTITGTTFNATAANDTVKFNGVVATITSASATSLVVSVPAAATTGPVTVTTPDGLSNSVNFTVTPGITGLSVGNGPVGTPITITGTTFNATAANDIVKFNGVAATVTAASATSLSVTVPAAATTGPVTVTTPDGTSAGATFTVTPKITGLSATSGPVGNSIVLTGTTFNPITANDVVKFNGVTATVTAASATSLTVTVPTGATTGLVTVTTPDGTSNSVSFTVTPKITSLSATNGAVGTAITITGTTFNAAAASDVVKFNGITATVSAASVTSLNVTVPPNATTGQVTVTTPDGTSNSVSFTVTPKILSLSASSGVVGTPVTITGTTFNTSALNDVVKFNGTTATVTSASATSLAVTVPFGATTGLVTVTTPDGTTQSPANFLVVPAITGLDKSSGSAGANVTISGNGFDPIAANDTVRFNGTTANISAATAGSLSVTVPAAATSGLVTVTTSGGTGSSPMTFTVIPPPPQSDTPIVTAAPARDTTSDGVGATLAQFRVDEGGNATYSIPIQIPPGTAGLAPKIALTYNSRAPASVMGPGWGIEGASQIARCRQARENGDFMSGSTPQDGNPAPVNFTTSDRFCLDGVRLLLLSGTYGGHQSTYSPENDPTTRVTAYLTSATNPAPGPVTFTVQRKDGTSATYGSTITSINAGTTATVGGQSVNVAWSVARVQDSAGNYMDYAYNNQPASGTYGFAAGAVESTLAQVSYTGHLSNPATSTYASVTFSYATLAANQTRLGYQAGVAFLQSQQLQSVTVTDSTQAPATLRYYQISYQASAAGTVLSQVSQVQECRDSTLAVCYPATTFAWSSMNSVLASEGTQSGPNFTNLDGYKMADVDGDGRMDFVFAVHGDSHCFPSTNSAIYVGFMDRSGSQMTLNLSSQTPVCATINLGGNDQAWYLVDYDGDGLADLMIGGASASSWAAYPSLGRPSSGKVFGATNLLAGLTTPIKAPSCYTLNGAQVCNNAAAILADLNGDGLPDFLYPNPDPLSQQLMLARMMVRTGSGFGLSDPYTVALGDYTAFDDACLGADNCYVGLFSNDSYNRSAISTDLDSDGRADLTFSVTGSTNNSGNVVSGATNRPPLSYAPTGSSAASTGGASGSPQALLTRNTYWYQFTTATIDPTAKSITMNPYWHQQAKTGSYPNAALPSLAASFFVVDINGDGLADVLYQDPNNSTNFVLLLNKGNGYAAPIVVSGIVTNSTDSTKPPTIQLADINGDGRPDIVFPASATGTSGYNYVSLQPSGSGWAFTAPQAISSDGTLASAGSIALLGDFDGDGTTDLLRINRTASANLFTARASSANRYRPRDVITGFTNGLGANTTVVYQPLTNHGIYQWGVGTPRTHAVNSTNWGYGSPVFDVLAPMYVVSQASSSAPTQNAPNAVSTVYYRYQGALMQSGGRGFLGFWAIWAFDANDAANEGNRYMVTLNGYGQQYPFIGFPEATYKLAFSGSLTRGSAVLDACAISGPEANTSCFAPGLPNSAGSDPSAWPDIIANGVYVGASETLPYCNGAGCAAMPVAFTNACTGATSVINGPSLNVAQITDGIFSPPATPGPIFTYATQTGDSQFDLGDGPGAGGVVYTSHVQSNNCYDTTLPSHGNLINSAVVTSTDGSSSSIVQQKYTANTYGAENTASWFLGRLTNSTITFKRPGASTVTRWSDFTYDPTTGLLTSERIQKGAAVDKDLRTLYTLDAFGNRTAAYQCSNDLTDAQCTSTSGFVEQQSGTQVHRYAKTTFDSRGRYSTSSKLPFTNSSSGLDERTAVSIGTRDEFGNPTSQNSINGTVQTSLFGALGRPYFSADNTGKAGKTTYRACGGGTGCSSDTMFKFRSQTESASATKTAPTSWTYFDILGRPVLKIAQNFNIENNTTGQLYSGTCTFYDSHNRPKYQSEPFFVAVNTAADGAPNLTSVTSSPCASAPYATTSQYDVLGRVVKVTNPDGGIVNKSYIGLTTFTSSPRNAGWQWEETRNALGEVVETRDPDDPSDPNDNLVVDTYYDAAGNVSQATRDAGHGVITTLMNYDVLGRKINQTDPDAGFTSYTYNAAGDVVTQTDAKLQKVTNKYDAMGRRYQRTISAAADGNNFSDTWTYDTAANGFGQLASESRPAFGTQQPFSRTYVYDAYGRLYQRTTTISATSIYTETTAYDAYSRVKAQQDASGYNLSPHYTAHGFVDYQTDSRTGTRTYQMNSANERGEVVSEVRGGNAALTSVHSYSAPTGRLYQLCSGNNASLSSGNCSGGNLQNLAYNFDLAGNLSARSHLASSQTYVEFFKYDALSRLTQVGVPQISTVLSNPAVTPALTLTYDKLGNICSKTLNGQAAQNYSYVGAAGCTNHGTSGSPHAVSAFSGVSYQYDQDGNQINSTGGNRVLTFDALNQMTKASNTSDTAQFQYAETGERFQRLDQNGKRTTYIGNVEIIVTGGVTETRRYLAGVAIDYLRSSGINETRYVFGDHLGSTDVIVKADGTTEQTSFDAHGNRRDPNSWSGTGTPLASTTHGYTGHEQLDTLGIIHMNGRIYDPQLGRMLQADPLTGPGPQGLNRYSYVANNPLSLTDPTGYSWWGWVRTIAAIAITVWTGGLALAASSFLEGMAIAAAGGFAAGVIQTGTLQGGLIGAFSAAAFFGIGHYFQAAEWAHDSGEACTANLTTAGATGKILAHGIAGGVMQALQGGKFGAGFLSAGVAEAASPLINGLDPSHPVGQFVSAQRVVAAGILGGTTSVIAGGKFANGAITGAFSRAFNEETESTRPRKSFLAVAEERCGPWADAGRQAYPFEAELFDRYAGNIDTSLWPGDQIYGDYFEINWRNFDGWARVQSANFINDFGKDFYTSNYGPQAVLGDVEGVVGRAYSTYDSASTSVDTLSFMRNVNEAITIMSSGPQAVNEGGYWLCTFPHSNYDPRLTPIVNPSH